jgi:ribokinase
VPLPAVRAAIELARAAGARVVMDAAPPAPLPDDLYAAIDLIRVNADEAAALTGVTAGGPNAAAAAARRLLERGAGAACVGAPGGDLLVWPGDELWLPHLPVAVVDATGAGDAFAAGLAVGLAEGRALRDAARLAAATSALATTVIGAQPSLPRRDAVEALLSG